MSNIERHRLIRHYAWKMSEETLGGDPYGNRIKLSHLLELFAADIDAQNKAEKEASCPAHTAESKPNSTTGQTEDSGTTPNSTAGGGVERCASPTCLPSGSVWNVSPCGRQDCSLDVEEYKRIATQRLTSLGEILPGILTTEAHEPFSVRFGKEKEESPSG